MTDKALEHLIKMINDKVLQLQEALADDNVKDYSEYKKTCGEVKGLLTARIYIIDLQQRLRTSDDE
jgi:uncharacterized protein YaaR (DUF327 family)